MDEREDRCSGTYHVVDPEDLDPEPASPCERRAVGDELALSMLAVAVYTIAPGEELARMYHYHEQREELFSVRDGTLRVETPERHFEVEPGEVFVAEPGSPHRAYNPGAAEHPVEVLGVGAPKYDVAREYDPRE